MKTQVCIIGGGSFFLRFFNSSGLLGRCDLLNRSRCRLFLAAGGKGEGHHGGDEERELHSVFLF